MIKKIYIILLIIALGALLRFFGINWDSGFNLHPDERAIILSTLPLNVPKTAGEFLSSQSSLNPHFFAYGSLPIYFLKITSQIAGFIDPLFATYAKMYLVGRFISASLDTLTIIIVYKLTAKIKNETAGTIAAYLYAISVLPIQLAHFYAVDTPLTFLTTLILYNLILFYEHPSFSKSLRIGLLIGFAIATKNSALVLLSAVTITLVADFILLTTKNPKKLFSFSDISPLLKNTFLYGITISLVAPVVFIALEPYAYISFQEFWGQTLQQYEMTHSALTFPYTLQYVNKIPYIYEIKNIFLWGLGPLLASICFIGILYTIKIAFLKEKQNKWAQELILLTFFWSYFIIVGKFAIGFMRYMLPLYPLLCICGGIFIYFIFLKLKPSRIFGELAIIGGALILLIYPISFLSIYTKPNTRVLATNWILQNIPSQDTIAIEHWDDGLPLINQQQYNIETLELYNPDTQEKWQHINEQLGKSDYIIIASNRLYTPLQKLTDCQKLPQNFCYQQTASYYKNLFSGTLGFKEVTEFTSYPTIPIINKYIVDDLADESFTVYDHPKIYIFKKSP